MQNNKLFAILKTFNKTERNRLQKLIDSPYFNANKALVQLFDLLEQNYIDKGFLEDTDKQGLWDLLYPGKKFIDQRFRKLLSDMLKLVEQFLVQEKITLDSLQFSIYLAESVAERGVEKMNNTVKRTMERYLEEFPYENAEFYLKKYLSNRAIYELEEINLKRKSDGNLRDINENLDIFYLTEKLKIIYESFTRKSVIEADFGLTFEEEIIELVKKADYKTIPSITFPFSVLMAYREDSEASFKVLEFYLNEHIAKFPKEEAESYFTYAINFCIRMINKNRPEYYDKFLEINEQFLESGIVEKGELSPWRFRNTVIIGLRAGRYDFVKNYIDSYLDFLPEEYRDNAYSFNIANYYFYKKEYDKVIQNLLYVKYEDITYELNSRVMLICTYYELTEQELAIYQCDSFRIYLNRHSELSKDKKILYTNFMKYVKRIINTSDSKKWATYKQEIETLNEPILNKSWLLEKLDELLA